MSKDFSYINKYYSIQAEAGKEVIFEGIRKGVIVEELGPYIGVNFYDDKPGRVHRLHPTYNLQILETYGKIRKMTKSQQRYQEYLEVGDCYESFAHFLGIKKRN